MPDPGRTRTAVVGYQGYWNVGDEAILCGIEALLAGTGLEVVTVFCGPGPVPAFPAARRVRQRRLLPTPAAFRELRRVSVLVIGGGGLLNDYWLRAIPRYLGWIVAARLAGARVVWLGVGVGPIRRRPWRWLANSAARLSTLVTVRDPGSRALLGRVPFRVAVHVVPDPALSLPRPEPEAGDPARPAGTALVIRPPAPTELGCRDVVLRRLAATAASLLDEGRGPIDLVTMAGHAASGLAGADDAAFAEALRARIAAARPSGAVGILELPPDPAAAMRAFAACHLVVSMRLHGVILATLAGVPCVPVAYDPKVRAGAAALGLGSVTLGLDDLGPDAVRGAIAIAEDPATVARVASALARLRADGPRVARLVRLAVRA